MNIVIITHTFFPLNGGTEQTIYSWASRLKKHHNVRILTLRIEESPGFELLEGSIPVFRIRHFTIPLISFFLRAAAVFLKLAALHKKSKIDLIHLGHVYYMGAGTILFKKLFKIPCVNTLLGADTYDPIIPVSPIFNPYMAWVMNSSERVVTMTNHMKLSAEKQGCKKEILIIPHGSDMHDTGPSAISIREKHSIDDKTRISLSLQRLDIRKGLKYLIEAIPSVIKQYPDTVFLLAGKGPLLETLKKQAEETGVSSHVIFAGFVPDEELSAYYEQADIFTLPTLYEGFGIVYVDAMAKGLPIVTTSVGGALDLIDRENGILVPPADPSGLADGIIKAFRTDWNRKKIMEKSARYNWDSIVEEYDNLYNQIT